MLSFKVPHEGITLISLICLVLSCVCVSLRIWVRLRWLKGGLRSDDWAILIAQVVFTTLCIMCFVIAHVEKVNPVLTLAKAGSLPKLQLGAEGLFMIASVWFKISLTIFFRRLMVDQWQRTLILIVGILYCGTSFANIFVGLFQCGVPVDLLRKFYEKRCISIPVWDGLLYWHGTMSALGDWIYALLPIIDLYRSSMSRATKISASLLLMMACGGSVAAVGRTISSANLRIRPEHFDPAHRPTFYTTSAVMVDLGIAELGLGIAAVSLACCRPLFRAMVEQGKCLWKSSRSHYSSPDSTESDEEKGQIQVIVPGKLWKSAISSQLPRDVPRQGSIESKQRCKVHHELQSFDEVPDFDFPTERPPGTL